MKPPDRTTQRVTFRKRTHRLQCDDVSRRLVSVRTTHGSCPHPDANADGVSCDVGSRRNQRHETDRSIADGCCNRDRRCRRLGRRHRHQPAVKPGPPSAKEIRGASPYAEIKNEPAPKLFVDPPLPDLLDQGVVWIQWRVENVQYPAGVREGCAPRLSTGRSSARTCGRRAVVVGRRKQYQHDRLGRFAAWPAQDPGRTGGCQPSALPGPIEDGHVHHTQGRAGISLSLSDDAEQRRRRHKLRFDGGLDSTDGPPTRWPGVLPRTTRHPHPRLAAAPDARDGASAESRVSLCACSLSRSC